MGPLGQAIRDLGFKQVVKLVKPVKKGKKP